MTRSSSPRHALELQVDGINFLPPTRVTVAQLFSSDGQLLIQVPLTTSFDGFPFFSFALDKVVCPSIEEPLMLVLRAGRARSEPKPLVMNERRQKVVVEFPPTDSDSGPATGSSTCAAGAGGTWAFSGTKDTTS